MVAYFFMLEECVQYTHNVKITLQPSQTKKFALFHLNTETYTGGPTGGVVLQSTGFSSEPSAQSIFPLHLAELETHAP